MKNKNGSIVVLLVSILIIPGCGGPKNKGLTTSTKKYEQRSINGRVMANRIKKRIEDELMPRAIDKRYIADQVQKIAHNELGGKSFAEIKDALLEAHCLKVPHVVNAIAAVLVYVGAKQVEDIVGEESDTIPQELHIYLKKHLKLKKSGVEKESSIADLIANNEEIIVHDEHGYNLKLQGKHITSLYGIKHLHGTKCWGTTIDVAAIEHLYLRSNYILDQEHDPDFPVQPFEQFSGLRTLCLDENLLTCLPPTIFAGLDNLSHIYLSDNELTSLPEEIFHGLTRLDHLEISNNKLASLPPTIFQGLNNLLWLGLNYNQLAHLPEDIFKGLSKLFLLEMSHNRLASLPAPIFQGLVKLEVLDLGHNQLASLPENIFQALPQLKNLDLIANNLTRLPETIFQVVNRFGSLRLGGNMLSEEEQHQICDFCIDKDCEVSLS